MKAHIIIQARMGSTRLPGKVMREVRGKPLLGWLLDRLKTAEIPDRIIVAIPECDFEGKLGHYLASRRDVDVVSGPEDDVAGRFALVLRFFPCDAFVRICADSPLLDGKIVDNALEDTSPGQFGFFSYDVPGSSVEVMDSEMFLSALDEMDAEEREHVTLYWKRRLSLVVDTEEDFQRVAGLIESFDDEPGDLDTCLNVLAQQL